MDFCLDGGDFVSSQSRYYVYMINPSKDRSYSSLYLTRGDAFSTSGDGRGGFGTMTTNLSYHKVDFSTYKNDRGFWQSKFHNTASPMT